MKTENVDIEEMVDSFTEYEFGAVTAVLNWLNEYNYFSPKIEELNDVILKRAEKEVHGKKPKLEVKQYLGDGKYDYAIFRSDRTAPLCKGISKAHGEHLKIILGRMEEMPESIKPIKDWYDYQELVDIDEDGYGKK